MNRCIHIIALTFIYVYGYSQNTIRGNFSDIVQQQLKLIGFNGFDTYVIDSTVVSEAGDFRLSFSSKDYGMGYLTNEDNKHFMVILSADENLNLQGVSPAYPETVNIISGRQNSLFEHYANEHVRREHTLSAWDYLAKIYNLDSLFIVQEVPKKAILQEKQRIKTEDSLFLSGLAPQTYVSWYLPVRKLVSSVSTIAQYRTEEISASIDTFRNIDYTDPRLYKSGMLKDVIESHFWLIENSRRSLDSVFIEMNISIDYMFETLTKDEKKLNEISEYLFKLLERRSLFASAEYLALKVLNKVSCTINNNLSAQLESYRAMKIGNFATDIEFKGDVLSPTFEKGKVHKRLSDIKSNYTVVIFGASWCSSCPDELFQIVSLYQKWKKLNIEVIFVSLDDNKNIFKSFASIFPFISICDYFKWDSPIVKTYYIFATPTIYLLNNKREILLKPNSVKQLDEWVNWYLVQDNK